MIKNVAVLGFGSIGQKHCKILTKLLGKNNIHVFSSQKNIPYKNSKSFKDIYNFNPDYIVLASSTNLHYEQLIKIESNFKNKVVLIIISRVQSLPRR